ncbi:MAG: 1-deoxy-D-xylulose-5-phosphate synthase [Planctomycetales bacterium]|nr:1-deoxy-D-xylulose-5-phosphate synthase [Planctomycetales bacterium]
MKQHRLLSQLESATQLHGMNARELDELAAEVRDVLCGLLSSRSAHFASNLGVVELCLALHSVFDFRRDRLIWDTGHQIYPHKLVTGRYHEFQTIRSRGGLMGYPNPAESEYDLFMTGHAGSSVSTVLGLRSGDELLGEGDRYSVAVIGDGAFPSGIVYEALNNAAGLKKPLLVILNDNKMSICPRVGGLASYLDRLRSAPFYSGLKLEVQKILNKVPLLGDPTERFLAQIKEGIKAGLHGGMMFEDLGMQYVGPIDGHDIVLLRKYLRMVRKVNGPVLLHVVTDKGHGFEPAEKDPVYFHAPPAFEQCEQQVVPKSGGGARNYTHEARDAICDLMREDNKVVVLTAAMCQGTKLEPARDEFPDRFFDTGICESHAVAFAAGQCKAGLRPIVAIYSTFLQRSFDQIFQEVALQNLPVLFMLDRAGLAGADGPTHHGAFDLSYMRVFPNIVCMAPADAWEVHEMVKLARRLDSPASIRYPKAVADTIDGPRKPLELGRGEMLRDGADGAIIACGAMTGRCLEVASLLAEEGLDIRVINARFIRPLDEELILGAMAELPFVVTVEEGALAGGFGSAVLEAAAAHGVQTRIRCLGIPDRFIEHGDRDELLADLGLDVAGIAAAVRNLAHSWQSAS